MRGLLILIVVALIAAAAWFYWKDGKLPFPTSPAGPTEPATPGEQPTEPSTPAEPDPEPEPSEPPAADVYVDKAGRTFSYYPAGDHIPGSAPANVIVDATIYDDKITFPAEDAVFINSQVYGAGGSQAAVNGLGASQCDPVNYNYPWRENFCEKRGKNQYFCAQGGHTGVDIRPATCKKSQHWVIAPEKGVIYSIGSYGVRLMADDGTWWQFLHMDSIAVAEGQKVEAGQRLGKFSNVFFDSQGKAVPTTIHMHLDMKESYAPTNGDAPFVDRVNPYMTLVAAYERKLAAETP
ncbi:MAG: M23 family metallopeptidase [Parvularculaceae bacterium]|nr:M23 family metallopeptidase [Parvularculaceae bacterium]